MYKVDTCSCRYKYCIHPGERLLKTDAVRVGNIYYHKDCYEEMRTAKEIIDYFINNINKNVVVSRLRKAINDICFPNIIDIQEPETKKGISPERLLYQLKYCCKHGWHLKYPGGLYYVAQDRESYEAYEKHKAKQRVGNYDFNAVEEDLDLSQSKKVRIKKQKSFEDILGG